MPLANRLTPARCNKFQLDVSWLDKFTLPSLEADQRILDAGLVVFGHVLVHIGVVLPDVALSAAVGNRPKAKWRGIGVRTLELQGEKQGKQTRERLCEEDNDNMRWQRDKKRRGAKAKSRSERQQDEIKLE